MARKKTTRPTSFGEVFDLGLLKQIGFPLAFPIMPLEAFLWASDPGRFNPFNTYEIFNGRITQTDGDDVKRDIGMLSERLCYCSLSIGDVPGLSGGIKGDFVGSKQAIDLFKAYEKEVQVAEDFKQELIRKAASSISGKGNLFHPV